MHEDLTYVSYAFEDIKLRNRVTTIQEFHKQLKNKNFECYRTLFRFGKEYFFWVQKNKTVAGYRGICWLDEFVIDIDDPDNLENAKIVTIKLADFLENHGITCNIAFSGNKGFHLKFPFTLDIEPTDELPQICKKIAQFISEEAKVEVEFDTKIYEINRLMRVLNTINKKSGLYKIPLTSTELKDSTIEEIRNLAQKPRKVDSTSKSDGKYLIELYDKYIHAKGFNEEHFQDRLPCYSKLLEGVEKGERDAAGIRLACYFRSKHLDQSIVENLLKDWNKRNNPPLPESELTIACIKAAFEHKYRYGCKDELLSKYCNPVDCPITKKLGQRRELHIFNIREAIDTYYTWLKDYSKINMTLGLPTIDKHIRLFPGILIQILGATSVGKTALIMNILYHLNKEKFCSLLIALEQASQMITERFLQRSLHKSTTEIFTAFSKYESAREAAIRAAEDMPNVFISDESVLSIDSIKILMEEVYYRYGKKISAVAVDYIQLVKGAGQGRYEKMTNIAQSEKRLAKDMGIILFSMSQIGRKEPTDPVTLHSAKESGAIEEGADIVLGVWQSGQKDVLMIDMLKNKTGRGLDRARLTFEKDIMHIQEVSQIKI